MASGLSSCRKWPPCRVTCGWPWAPGTRAWNTASPPLVIGSLSLKAVISGRGYGVTNLVVIDQLGRTVLERQVVVAAPSQGRVSVIRGPRVEEYACAGGCERSGGDSAKP